MKLGTAKKSDPDRRLRKLIEMRGKNTITAMTR